jgi:hypothetical protein
MAIEPKNKHARKIKSSPRFIFASGDPNPLPLGIDDRRFGIIDHQPNEETMDIELKRGQALVLCGPRGCGKTTTALQLAAGVGLSYHAAAGFFQEAFGLAPLADGRIKTLIIEGWPRTQQDLERFKTLLTDDEIEIDRMGQWPVRVAAPYLIFCTERPPKIDPDDRRFRIVPIKPIDRSADADG